MRDGRRVVAMATGRGAWPRCVRRTRLLEAGLRPARRKTVPAALRGGFLPCAAPSAGPRQAAARDGSCGRAGFAVASSSRLCFGRLCFGRLLLWSDRLCSGRLSRSSSRSPAPSPRPAQHCVRAPMRRHATRPRRQRPRRAWAGVAAPLVRAWVASSTSPADPRPLVPRVEADGQATGQASQVKSQVDGRGLAASRLAGTGEGAMRALQQVALHCPGRRSEK